MPDHTVRRIGFVGLGHQGTPLAMRLAKAGPLTVCDLVAAATAPLAAAGAAVAADAAALGALCDFVGVCVLDDAALRNVVAGPSGLLRGMARGGIIAVHSTVLPDTCRDLAQQCAAQGVTLIDAPVSGSPQRGEAGEMVVMLGGDDATVAICRDILAAFATTIVHLGEVGAGQHAKAVNNTLMAANLVLAHQALEAGVALGLDRAALHTVLRNASGQSFSVEVLAMLSSLKDFDRGARLLKKDVGIMAACANSDAAREIVAVAERLQGHVYD